LEPGPNIPGTINVPETIWFTPAEFGCIKLLIWAVTTKIVFRIVLVLIWPWKPNAVQYASLEEWHEK
jgi:hypothetical protein